jgi:arylsulfatase A-like enzyme/HEAT repeat protein
MFESGKASLARGVLGAWGLVCLQFLLLLTLKAHLLSGLWEAQSGAIGLLPSWLLLASVPGAVGGLCPLWLAEVSDGLPWRRARIAGLFFVLAILVGWGVGGGRHLADFSTRIGFSVCVGLVGGACAFASARPVARFLRSSLGAPTRRWVFALGGLALIACLEVANARVLVRLYPAFHGALSFFSFFVAGAVSDTLANGMGPGGAPSERPRPVPLALLFVLSGLALGAALLKPASSFIGGFDNFRWMVGESAPSLSWGLELASRVSPPPPLDADVAKVPLGQRRSQGALDLRGRDILLISIDALRADHVGAYGYKRPTTPAIDTLAEGGVVFDAAYAPTPHTSYSITSLMTGKYMRPLLLQGAGEDSDLFAHLLQSYDFRTAAFYPPAVFFIDTPRFGRFEREKLGFEYAKVEFAEGALRVRQFEDYLGRTDESRRVFTWVHLFGPHEPYEAHPNYDFGKLDVDLYDSEIRAADDTVSQLVKAVRARDPKAVVILTADHGEEFGDHGGRYHGTSVYDEQVRVPLIFNIPEGTGSRRIKEPVQTIDLLPTVLSGLGIPVPPRIRGRDLTPFLAGQGNDTDEGRAIAETDEYTLLAEGNYRLICLRRSGACRLYDTSKDPKQVNDLSRAFPDVLARLRDQARSLAESHGAYESSGLRAEGKGWPPAILRGISGDGDVAPELSQLLDDADRAIRVKAAELLFDLGTNAEAPALRLAMTREEDTEARAWLALSLTRLGQGAPLVFELLGSEDLRLRRFAALALAEAGNDSGEDELIRWWAKREDMDHELALRILRAFAKIRSKDAVNVLLLTLGDVRLRPFIASTLGAIGDKDARPHLAAALLKERYRSARLPLATAIVDLGGDDELIVPLRRFLGVPEMLEGAIELAERARILDSIGGPKEVERQRLQQLSDSGIRVTVVVPPGPKNVRVRVILRARSRSGAGGEVLLEPGRVEVFSKKSELRHRNQPEIASSQALKLEVPSRVPAGSSEGAPVFFEVARTLPQEFGAQPGHHLSLEVFAPGDIEISALVAVPEVEDLPPPPPEPWENKTKSESGAALLRESVEGHSP